ncbi:MAG TPA: aromatic compound catabolic protein, partial [Caldimonas sp.]
MAAAPAPADASALLEQWRAEEAAVRARMTSTGIVRAEEIAGKTGLQMFEAMLAGELPRAPIADTLDFALIDVTFGHAVF